MMPKRDFNFSDCHDAVVSHLDLEDGKLRLTLEFYHEENKDYERVHLVFHGVEDSQMNGARTSIFKADGDEGEVIDFVVRDKIAAIVIQWDKYEDKTRSTSAYRFSFKTVDITDERT